MMFSVFSSLCVLCDSVVRFSSPTRKQLADRDALAVFRRVERAFLDFESSLRRDTHCGEDRRVQIADRDWVLRREQRALRRGFAVEKRLLDPAAEHQHRTRAGEM